MADQHRNPRGGVRECAGRPKGTRTKLIAIKLSQQAIDKLNKLTDNRSEYIDNLIIAQ